MFDYTGKNVLITGGTRGIGYQIVEEYAKCNANVAYIYSSSVEKAKEIDADLNARMTGKIRGYQADVTDGAAIKNVIEQIKTDFGGIDILVNNAGIIRDCYLMLMGEDDWKDVININLISIFDVIKQVLPMMLEKRSGSIVNITSVSGMIGTVGQTNYSASKAGIIGLTKSLAKEVAQKGIRVNAIAPGFIESDMTEQIPEKIRKSRKMDIPAKKFGTAKNVADAVLFLTSEYASYIYGQVIVVDGGLTC